MVNSDAISVSQQQTVKLVEAMKLFHATLAWLETEKSIGHFDELGSAFSLSFVRLWQTWRLDLHNPGSPFALVRDDSINNPLIAAVRCVEETLMPSSTLSR